MLGNGHTRRCRNAVQVSLIHDPLASHQALGSSGRFGRQIFPGLRAASAGRSLTHIALLRPLALVQPAHAHLDARVARHVSAAAARLRLLLRGWLWGVRKRLGVGWRGRRRVSHHLLIVGQLAVRPEAWKRRRRTDQSDRPILRI